MEELKARITTQFKLLDLAEKETEKINARNRNEIEIESKIERHLNHVKRKRRTIKILNTKCWNLWFLMKSKCRTWKNG